jgi:hypothetical protein
MLGGQIYEAKGKRGPRKVVSADNGFKVEVSFEANGKMLGVDSQEIGTYISGPRPDGSLYGEGQGVIMGADGSMATWKGAGVGKFVGPGAVSYRGAVYYSTASPAWARLNAVAQVFEFEVDSDGTTKTKGWEWK